MTQPFGGAGPAVNLGAVSDPVLECLRLVSILNAMGLGLLDAPRAEYALRMSDAGEPDRPHHVADPGGLLGPGGPDAVPARLALARVAGRMPGSRWVLVIACPGDLGGLRGPATTNEQALAHGAAVVAAAGGPAWLPQPVGPAMQWQLVPAERPLPPPTPGEASTALDEQILASARELAGLGVTGGQRPEGADSIVLGRAYPGRNQKLLDKALLWRAACAAGLEDGAAPLHSHAELTRSAHLRRLDALCRQAISAAAGWPAAPHTRAGG